MPQFAVYVWGSYDAVVYGPFDTAPEAETWAAQNVSVELSHDILPFHAPTETDEDE